MDSLYSVKMLKCLKTFFVASHFYFRSPVYKKQELIYTSVHAARARIYINILLKQIAHSLSSHAKTQGKPRVCKKSAAVLNSALNLFEVIHICIIYRGTERGRIQIWEAVTSSPSTNLLQHSQISWISWMPWSTLFTSPPQNSQLRDLVQKSLSNKTVKPSHDAGDVENNTGPKLK